MNKILIFSYKSNYTKRVSKLYKYELNYEKTKFLKNSLERKILTNRNSIEKAFKLLTLTLTEAPLLKILPQKIIIKII